MKLSIDHKKISVSPYKKDTDSFFTFTQIEVEEFVGSILHSNATCHYISGYRGVGKTSFIKKIEEELEKKNGFIFVHVPIIKYDEYEILIRSFVRQFYFQFIENKDFEKTDLENIKIQNAINMLNRLNRETFSNIVTERIDNFTTEKESELTKYNSKDAFVLFILAFVTVLLFCVDFESGDNYKLIAQIASTGLTIAQAIKLGNIEIDKESKLNSNKETETSLYDDDIIEHRFINLIKAFKEAGLRPVFIIDELDKLEMEEAKKILFLFKSAMLSGNANFIVVGGQELYYEIHNSHEIDDSILSTLFSKIHHVRLKSSPELRDIFGKLLLNDVSRFEEIEKTILDNYISNLIIESRKIPRKFINLIHNDLYFEDDKAYINISDSHGSSNKRLILDTTDKELSKMGESDFVRDYLTVNVLKEVNKFKNYATKLGLEKYINDYE